ncbi:MAG: NifB/NifX family molybdenum-iron cluster-binding protein [Candidatus Kariarchaeaceae archaeon]|jgi:predicted Fe-Mo cluster-binding NifX family protein
MKVCIPSSVVDPTLDSKPEPILGNAKSYLIYDRQSDKYDVIPEFTEDNYDCKLAMYLDDYNVDVVIAHKLCETCFGLFESMDIDLWRCDGCKTIREVYQKYIMGGIFHRNMPDVCDCPHKHDATIAEVN